MHTRDILKIKKGKNLVMSIKSKIKKGMESYILNTMLPHCYNVAVRHGFVGDQEDYAKEVLASMKGETYFAPTSEVA